MKNFRRYKNKNYQFTNFNLGSAAGKINKFLQNSSEKIYTINNLRNSIGKQIKKEKFSEGIRILEKERVLKIVAAEKLFLLWGEKNLLVDCCDKIYLESLKKNNPRQNLIINSFPFIKDEIKHLDKNNEKRFSFDFWDMYLDALNDRL